MDSMFGWRLWASCGCSLVLAGCGETSSDPQPPADIGQLPIEVTCTASPCVTSVAAGYWHTCATLDDGRVFCWGARADGATGYPADETYDYFDEPTLVPGVLADRVEAGGTTTCIRRGSQVTCWGYLPHQDDGGQPSTYPLPEVVLERDIVQLSVASRNICVLLPTGVPLCYGGNDYGQLGRETYRPAEYPDYYPDAGGYPSFEFAPADVGRIKRLGMELDITCAIDWNGHVGCWGYGQSGVLGFQEQKQQLAPIPIPGLERIVQVGVHFFHACAVSENGRVSCWGDDMHGSTGSDGEDSFPPREVAGVEGAAEVVCAPTSSCARTRDGHVYCWGSNSLGLLGGGTSDSERHPVAQLVPDLTDVVQLARAEGYYCALRRSGELRCWGANTNAGLGIGPKDDLPHAPSVPHWRLE